MPSNAEYWSKRYELLEQAQHDKAVTYASDLEKIYGQAVTNCEAEISKWYQRIAVNNQISYQEAQKLLTKNELKEFHWSVEEYIKNGEANSISKEWIKQLENASAKLHITRLEAMKMQMRQQVESVCGKQDKGMADVIKNTYQDSYYRSIFELEKFAGIGATFSKLDNETVNKIISKPWTADDMTFSERIWGKHRPELINKLQTDLSQAFIRGDNPKELVSKIRKEFDVTKSQAENLLFTESAFFRSSGIQKSYLELGVGEFEIDVCLDEKTCDICGAMDGLHFKVEEMAVGENHPPFHCRCRCTSVPYFDDEFTIDETRAARDSDGKHISVSANTKYEDWLSKYIDNDDKKSVDKTGKSSIIKLEAISGALNPESERAMQHAKQYYDSVRKMTTDVKSIAKNTGYSEKQIQSIKDFIFIDKHDLGRNKLEYFEPSYEMGQSWQRLIEGKNIQQHDLTLIKHEIMEKELMNKGISQDEAHILTSKKYDYRKECDEYYAQINKYK